MVEKQSVWGCPEFSSEQKKGDFSGGPVVKTLPSSAGGSGLIPGPGANSIKTFKITHIKKKNL